MDSFLSTTCARWGTRDWIAATSLFIATAVTVIWQDSRLTVLWDLSYVLDTAARIAAGQMPYRDFPLSHAPLTFLVQAAIMRLSGRVYWHHMLYAATGGGLGTVVAWRIVLHLLRARVARAWVVALVLSVPLTVLGVYGILPNPFYDCDSAFSMLVSLLLLQRLSSVPPTRLAAFFAGVAMVVPAFFKQNIGGPFLMVAFGGIALLLVVRALRRDRTSTPSNGILLTVLAGALASFAGALLLLALTAGIGNYYRWTIRFAAERRLPGLGSMLDVYAEPSLLWTLPCAALAIYLLIGRFAARRVASPSAFALLAAPFVWKLLNLLQTNDAEDRAASLLALWPHLLILAAALALSRLRSSLDLAALLPLIVLGAVNGTLLSQQLWGSTYAIWPLLILLSAGMIGFLARPAFAAYVLPLTSVIAASLLVCGGLYVGSAERLSYADVLQGREMHGTLPQLAGMTVRGPYLPDFEELLRFAAAEIPRNDGLILLPGEDPFYFATGRVPMFPVLLFDPATDPYSPEQTVAESRRTNIRWLIVKRTLQIREDPMPNRDTTMQLLQREFVLYRNLANYDVYRRP